MPGAQRPLSASRHEPLHCVSLLQSQMLQAVMLGTQRPLSASRREPLHCVSLLQSQMLQAVMLGTQRPLSALQVQVSPSTTPISASFSTANLSPARGHADDISNAGTGLVSQPNADSPRPTTPTPSRIPSDDQDNSEHKEEPAERDMASIPPSSDPPAASADAGGTSAPTTPSNTSTAPQQPPPTTPPAKQLPSQPAHDDEAARLAAQRRMARSRPDTNLNLVTIGSGSTRRQVDLSTPEGKRAWIQDQGTSHPRHDESAFATIQDNESDEEDDDEAEPRESEHYALLEKITLGTAVMDVRQLNRSWDPSSGTAQRAVDHQHIAELVDSFKVSIDRAAPDKRLYVSMTKEDLKSACDSSGTADLYSEITEPTDISTADMLLFPFLALPIQDRKPTITCTLEAGQHRVLALVKLAEGSDEATKYGINFLSDLSNPLPERLRALTHFGWTCTIIDADELKKPENQLALSVVRGNRAEVKLSDAPGLIFHNGLVMFQNATPQQQEAWSKDFPNFARRYLGVKKKPGKRLLKAFKMPPIRVFLQALTTTRWGQDTYTERRLDDLFQLRNNEFAKKVVDRANRKIDELLDPISWGTGCGDPLEERPSTLVSRTELNSLRACFGSNGTPLNKDKLRHLFFPNENDSEEDVCPKGMPGLNYKRGVVHPDRKMPAISLNTRAGREYRRPLFLDFLSNAQLQHVYLSIANKDTLTWSDQPSSTRDQVFVPSTAWWESFIGHYLPAMTVVMRLQWFCMAPHDFKLIAACGTKSLQLALQKNDDFDIGVSYRESYIQQAREEAVDDQLSAYREELNAAGTTDNEVEHIHQLPHQRLKQIHDIQIDAGVRFARYLDKLWQRIAKISSKVKLAEWEKACRIEPEYFWHFKSPTAMNFYRNMLELPALGHCFTKIMTLELNDPIFYGMARPLWWFGVLNKDEEIQNKTLPEGHKKTGPNFFNLRLAVKFNNEKGVETLIRTHGVLGQWDKAHQKEFAEAVLPVIDIHLTSLSMYQSWLTIDTYIDHWRKFMRADYAAQGKRWNNPVVNFSDTSPYQTSTSLKSEDDYIFHRQIIEQGLQRMEVYDVERLSRVSTNGFIEAEDAQVKKWLPHFGNSPYSTHDENGDILDVTLREFDFERSRELLAFLNSSEVPLLHHADDARVYFEQIAEQKAANKHKNTEAKKIKEAKLKGEVYTPKDQKANAKSKKPKPAGKATATRRRKAPAKSKKILKSADRVVDVSSESDEDPDDTEDENEDPDDNPRGKNTSDLTGANSEDDETEDEDEDGDEDKDHGDAVVVNGVSKLQLKKMDWGPKGTPAAPPAATIAAIARYLDVEDLNETTRQAWTAETDGPKGSYTTKQKKFRVLDVNQFLNGLNASLWRVTSDTIPDCLKYVSDTDLKKVARASKPAKAVKDPNPPTKAAKAAGQPSSSKAAKATGRKRKSPPDTSAGSSSKKQKAAPASKPRKKA